MAQKTIIDLVYDDVVSANSNEVNTSSVIPDGKIVVVSMFAGSAIEKDYCALQWGSGGSWDTIFASYGNFVMNLGIELVGDGSKAIRLVRANTSLLDARRIFIKARGHIL